MRKETYSTVIGGFGHVDDKKSMKGDIELRDDGYWVCTIESYTHTRQVEGGTTTTYGGQYMKISRFRAWCLMALKVLS